MRALQQTVTVSAGILDHFDVSAPSTTASGAAFSVTITAKDASNITLTGYVGTIHFATSDPGAGVLLPGNYTFGAGDSGSHTFASGVTLKTAGNQTVSVNDTVQTLKTGSATVLVTAGAAAKIALYGATTSLTSGATRVLTATIQDAAGNTVTTDSSTVITFAQTTGAGSVSGLGTATVTNGVATKTVTGVLAGSVTIAATSGSLAAGSGNPITFSVVAGAASQIALGGAHGPDLGRHPVLTATIQDAAGNTVTTDSSTVITFAQTTGAGSVSGLGTATVTNGVATKTVTGVLAGSVTIAATSGSLAAGSGNPITFSVVAGAASQIALGGATTGLTSGATRVLTATIQDAAGNTVTTDSSTVIAFAQTTGAGSVSGLGTATVTNGVATKTVTGVLAGSVTIAATSGSLAAGSGNPITFSVVAGAASQIALGGATGLTSGAPRTLTATIQDAAGNTVTTDSTTVITFAQTTGAGSVSGLGTATVTNGVATKTVTGVLAGSVTIAATSGLAAGSGNPITFSVVPGAAARLPWAVPRA